MHIHIHILVKNIPCMGPPAASRPPGQAHVRYNFLNAQTCIYPPPCPRHDSGVSPRALFTEISISTYYLRGFQPHYLELPASLKNAQIFRSKTKNEKVRQKEPPRTPKIQKIMKSLSREPSWERLGMGAAKNWSPEPSREAPICFLCGKYHASSTLHKIDPGSLSGSCLLPFDLL